MILPGRFYIHTWVSLSSPDYLFFHYPPMPKVYANMTLNEFGTLLLIISS